MLKNAIAFLKLNIAQNNAVIGIADMCLAHTQNVLAAILTNLETKVEDLQQEHAA